MGDTLLSRIQQANSHEYRLSREYLWLEKQRGMSDPLNNLRLEFMLRLEDERKAVLKIKKELKEETRKLLEDTGLFDDEEIDAKLACLFGE